jgi:peptide chain release factor 1
MYKKLEELEKKYEELNKNLSDPKIIANQSKFQECAKMHSDISRYNKRD